MQQLAQAGPRLPPAAMAAPRALLGHEPGTLERLLHEDITEAHLVLAPRDVVEVADVEALIVLPVQRQEALDLGHRRALGRRRAAPPVVEIVDAIPLELQPQAPDAARTAPPDVGRLDPRQLVRPWL